MTAPKWSAASVSEKKEEATGFHTITVNPGLDAGEDGGKKKAEQNVQRLLEKYGKESGVNLRQEKSGDTTFYYVDFPNKNAEISVEMLKTIHIDPTEKDKDGTPVHGQLLNRIKETVPHPPKDKMSALAPERQQLVVAGVVMADENELSAGAFSASSRHGRSKNCLNHSTPFGSSSGR